MNERNDPNRPNPQNPYVKSLIITLKRWDELEKDMQRKEQDKVETEARSGGWGVGSGVFHPDHVNPNQIYTTQ